MTGTVDGPGTLAAVVAASRIVVCCGSGGVGKTTTAAALALRAAEQGRRVVVITIDPARRLADALGLPRLGNEPERIDPVVLGRHLDGELWAMMLDPKATFDGLVARHAADTAQRDEILANRFYRNISEELSGTQEYMAMEKLHQLAEGSDFDLVVVDTPPTRNALDFIEAPARLGRFLDHPLFRVLTTNRGMLRAVNLAAQAFVRSVAHVVGAAVVDDAVAFFRAFEGMEDGFRQRARHVDALLRAPGTAFVLVASPRADAVEEAEFFADELAAAGIGVDALVVNRLHPTFGDPTPSVTRERAAALADAPIGPLYRNLAELDRVRAREERHVRDLVGRVAPDPVVRVPLLASDVHDVDGLWSLAAWLDEEQPDA